ncbi:MAG: PAS domain S-box protein [Candidatus Promineifilaceae bacterium]|nr:PAS domain S-box protein [Candidatus Promineifilaceae bacterium]
MFVLSLGLLIFVSRGYAEHLALREQMAVNDHLTAQSQALSQALGRRMARVRALHSYIDATVTERGELARSERLDSYVAGLYGGATGIRMVIVTRGGIVTHAFPATAADEWLGRDLLARPIQGMGTDDVLRAMRSEAVTITGPVAGKGSRDLILHQAVYKERAFYGLVSASLNLDALLSEAGLSVDGIARGGGIVGVPGVIQYALRDESGELLLGAPELFMHHAQVANVRAGNGEWQLAAAPDDGWGQASREPLLLFRAAGLLATLLLSSMTYLTLDQQRKLTDAVSARTRELAAVNAALQQDIGERERAEAALAEREAQYRSVWELTSDGLIITDLETGAVVDVNDAFARMHGYEREIFLTLDPQAYIHPDTIQSFVDYHETVRAGKIYEGRLRGVRPDGSRFHAEVQGNAFLYRGRPHALGVVRDVSDQVAAYQMLEERVAERTRELNGLLGAGRSLASTLELDSLLSVLLNELRCLVEFSVAAVITVDEATDVLSIATGHARLPVERVANTWPLEMRSLDERVIRDHESVIISDVLGDSVDAAAWRTRSEALYGGIVPDVRSWMAVPMLLKERALGMLVFGHAEADQYREEHARMALAFAGYAAIAIENARLYAQAGKLAALQERQRLARELHDSVSQALYGIALGARTARTVLEQSDIAEERRALLGEPLEYVLSLAKAGLAEMRALIFELRPESLETDGLISALERQAELVRHRHQLIVESDFGPEPALSPAARETLYRVAQEALNNVVKHAGAQTVHIAIREAAGQATLTVADDGCGFDSGGLFPGHMGLRSMRERAEAAGGRLRLESTRGRGTVIQVDIPTETVLAT